MKRYRLTKQNGNRAVFNEDFAKQSIDSVSLKQQGGFKFYDLIIPILRNLLLFYSFSI